MEKAAQKIRAGVILREEEVERYQNLKLSVYEDFKNNILNKNEYLEFHALYSTKMQDAEAAVLKLKEDIDAILSGDSKSHKWIEEFKRFRNITELTRKIAVSLIERISVNDQGIVDIVFKYKDKYQIIVEALSQFSIERMAV
jgi:hypothetical protein